MSSNDSSIDPERAVFDNVFIVGKGRPLIEVGENFPSARLAITNSVLARLDGYTPPLLRRRRLARFAPAARRVLLLRRLWEWTNEPAVSRRDEERAA